MSTLEGDPSRRARIVDQYRQITGALEQMFQTARLRTKEEMWRNDGVGSCIAVDRELSEHRLSGEAKEDLIKLRGQRNQEFGGNQSTLTKCPYHRENHGCVLGDLKSPTCIAFFENPFEWDAKFKIRTGEFRPEIQDTLSDVLYGDRLENPTSVEIFINRVKKITDFISTFPILHQPEQDLRKGKGI